jgi:KDO2-lipid IV(A) lauroyltransferase
MVPLRSWIFVGRCLGLLLYALDFQHRKIALTNLRFAFGREKDEKEIRSIARENFQQLGMIAHEWVRLRNMDIETLKGLVHVEGQKHLMAAKEKNQAIILLSAHFGNWEYANLFYSTFIGPLNFIVRAIDNPFLERERVAFNQRFGVNILYKENGLRAAIRGLKRGKDLIIFSDRKAGRKESIPCQFFGKKTSTLSVVPALAYKYHIPIVPMFIIRCEDSLHHRMVFFPELQVDHHNKQAAVQNAAQRQSDRIESVIRMYPGHWIWLHKRWKRYHPYLYPKHMAKRRRRKQKERAAWGVNT